MKFSGIDRRLGDASHRVWQESSFDGFASLSSKVKEVSNFFVGLPFEGVLSSKSSTLLANLEWAFVAKGGKRGPLPDLFSSKEAVQGCCACKKSKG